MKRKHTTVSIPRSLFKKIQRRIQNTGVASVSEYVTFVLREVISSQEGSKREEVFTKEDEERVKERLRALEYL